MIPPTVERRARWVLDTIGARDLGFGDDVPYGAEAWEQVDRGERPEGDDLAEAFFHLARVEERNGARDEHDRFRAAYSCLDPLDPPVERLRRRLVRCPGPFGTQGARELLSRDVSRAGEREHATALVTRDLGDDVCRGAEAVHAQALGLARRPQGAVADQPGA